MGMFLPMIYSCRIARTDLAAVSSYQPALLRNHSVVVIGGRLYPFGQNANGQLGNGSALNQLIPRQTEELDHVAAVFAGFDQTFILRSVGSPVCQRICVVPDEA